MPQQQPPLTPTEHAIARIWDSRPRRSGESPGRPVGAGFLAAPDRLVTAAHVVNLAIGRDKEDQSFPNGAVKVELDFPLVDPGQVVCAKVEHWVPPGEGAPGDVAVLILTDAYTPPVRPAPMVEPVTTSGIAADILGFPSRSDSGIWSQVRLRGPQADGWVQIDADQGTQFPIEQGFSGAPVLDHEDRTVIGMVSHAWSGNIYRSAYMVPVNGLFAACPGLREQARPKSPFPGLQPFSETDSSTFFGRGTLIDKIIELSSTAPIVTVTGGSGVGKSSLIAAGVIAALRKQADTLVAHCRLNGAQPPLQALAQALEHVVDLDGATAPVGSTIERLAAGLKGGLLTEATESASGDGRPQRMVLVVDQLEQVFAAPPDQVTAFGQTLSALVEDGGPLCLILGIRQDFLGLAGSHPDLGNLTAGAEQVQVADLKGAALREAIEGPLHLRQTVHFEPQLIEQLIVDVDQEQGCTPLVQFALRQLWDRQRNGVVDYATYRDLGDIRQMLGAYAERVWTGLKPAEKKLARRLLSQLVHPVASNDQVFTRRLVARSDISEELWPIAERLAESRLLVIGKLAAGRAEMTVGLAHESLVIHWDRLKDIAETDRDFRLWQDALSHRSEEWVQGPGVLSKSYWRQLLFPRLRRRADSGASSARLLAPGELREARRWQARNNDLSATEARYLNASRIRRKVQWTRAAAVAAIVAMVPLYLVVDANRAANEAAAALSEREALELSLSLAEASAVAGKTDGPLAQLLAAAAWEAFESDEAWAAMTNAVNNPATGLLSDGHTSPVTEVAFSVDGSMLASGANDGSITLWDTATWTTQHLDTDIRDEITALEFSPDGSMLAVGSFSDLILWDMGSETAIDLNTPDGIALAVGFSLDGTMFAAADFDETTGTTRLWDLETLEPLATIDTGVIGGLAFTLSSKGIIVADEEGLIRNIDIDSGETSWEVTTEFGPSSFYSLTVSREEPHTILACNTGCFSWTGEAIDEEVDQIVSHSFPGSGSLGGPASFTAAGDRVVAGLVMGDVGVWDAKSRAIIGILPTDETTKDIAVSPDGSTVVAAVSDGVQRWETNRLAGLTEIVGGEPGYYEAEFSSDGSRIVSTGQWSTRVIDPKGENEVVSEYSERAGHTTAASPNGATIATSLHESTATIEIWQLDTGEQVRLLQDDSAPVEELKFSPDGSKLVSASSYIEDEPRSDYEVLIWDTHTGEVLTRIEKDLTVTTFSVDFNPDGSKLATVDSDGAVQIWDATNGELLASPTGNDSTATDANFSPDGSLLAAATSTGIVLWDIASLDEEPSVLMSGAWLQSVTFSPDGRFIVATEDRSLSGSGTGSRVVVWDSERNIAVASIPTSSWLGESIDFSPDGSTIAVTGVTFATSGNIELFDLKFLIQDPYTIVCEQAGRKLTDEEWESYLGELPSESLKFCE